MFAPRQMRWFLQRTLKKWPELFWTSSCHDHLIRSDRWSMTSTICCPTPPISRMIWKTWRSKPRSPRTCCRKLGNSSQCLKHSMITVSSLKTRMFYQNKKLLQKHQTLINKIWTLSQTLNLTLSSYEDSKHETFISFRFPGGWILLFYFDLLTYWLVIGWAQWSDIRPQSCSPHGEIFVSCVVIVCCCQGAD